MNLDIDALRTFVAVAEHRNFTRAADVVSRTQSTVSVQIKNLEERLGFALFERTKRSVALTERGDKLLAYLNELVERFNGHMHPGETLAGMIPVDSLVTEEKGLVKARSTTSLIL